MLQFCGACYYQKISHGRALNSWGLYLQWEMRWELFSKYDYAVNADVSWDPIPHFVG
jgi:hypothetical protein